MAGRRAPELSSWRCAPEGQQRLHPVSLWRSRAGRQGHGVLLAEPGAELNIEPHDDAAARHRC